MHIIIPATGLGKRFVDAGYTDPKPFILVDGKPMIQHVIELFPNETKISIICREDMVSRMKSIHPTANILVDCYRGLGPVDTILAVADFIDDSEETIVSYCDYGTTWDYSEFKKFVRSSGSDGALACYRGFHPHNLGEDKYAVVRETNRVVQEVREKWQFSKNKLDDYTSNGTYYFRTGALLKKYCRALVNSGETINGEYYMSLVYNQMIQYGHKVVVFEIERMLQWGTPADLEEYENWSKCFRSTIIPSVSDGITLLPMAGRGSRFSMVGYETPKPFLPIHGVPMMVAAVECLPKTPELRIVTLTEHPNVQEYFPDAKVYRIPDVTDGQATTCIYALGDVSDDTQITITACDNGAIYDVDLLSNLMNDTSIDVIVWAFHNNRTSKLYPHMYAWLDVDSDMRLHDVSVKKPFLDKPNKYAIIGTMTFRRAADFKKGYEFIREHNIRTNGEFYVDNLLKPLIDMGKKIVVFPVDYYLCWGTPNDYKTFTYWESYFKNVSSSAPSKHA